MAANIKRLANPHLRIQVAGSLLGSEFASILEQYIAKSRLWTIFALEFDSQYFLSIETPKRGPHHQAAEHHPFWREVPQF